MTVLAVHEAVAKALDYVLAKMSTDWDVVWDIHMGTGAFEHHAGDPKCNASDGSCNEEECPGMMGTLITVFLSLVGENFSQDLAVVVRPRQLLMEPREQYSIHEVLTSVMASMLMEEQMESMPDLEMAMRAILEDEQGKSRG